MTFLGKCIIIRGLSRRCNSMAEGPLPKPNTRVRFPSSAPKKRWKMIRFPSFFYPLRKQWHIISPSGLDIINNGKPLLYIINRRLYHIRNDDIQCFALMIYHNKLWMIYKAHALIYLRECGIINSPINKNLTEGTVHE